MPTIPAQATAPDSPSADALPEGEGWWYARFRIARPEGEPTRWHIGTLLAGEVIAPVFDRHYGDILIWRIHRRAPQDEFGHVFSFIFYSTPAGAQRIYADIGNSPVLAQLRQDGDVTGVSFDNVGRLERPDIEDTSDASWLPVVQQTWPALIMGASRMWLDMVTVLAARQPQELDLEERYRAVQEEISRIWAEQGQHAVLHHLSAIYGYQPLLIRY
ncbi:MAG: hypothetical protein WBO34_00370 [Gammaproteobacteria bacterium]